MMWSMRRRLPALSKVDAAHLSDRGTSRALLTSGRTPVAISLALLASIFAGDRAPLTVVGDDDQAIYGWRDALPAAFDAFRRVFEGASVLPLTRNYRSGGHVVAARAPSSAKYKVGSTRTSGRPGSMVSPWLF